MPLSLFILALSAFAIGTTEFVIMGLLPDVAADLGVSIPGAGWLVTGYALGVAIGAPCWALATATAPRPKRRLSESTAPIRREGSALAAPGASSRVPSRSSSPCCSP